jgi:TRAP-type C4-dicarboxylate transport system permease large subunit
MDWMYLHAGVVLGTIIFSFIIARLLKLNLEISLFTAAVMGLVVHGIIMPPRGFFSERFDWFEFPRHIVDGAFTYLDVILIFLTATFFMNLYSEAGGIAFLIRNIIKRFYRYRILALLCLAFILLIPGALTGSGTVAVLIVGPLVAKVLTLMNLPADYVAAIIFLGAVMGAAAPPINLWAMMTAAGSNMPYVGFFLPLGILSVAGALFSILFLGRRSTAINLEHALQTLPEVSVGIKNWWKALAPFFVVLMLILAGRIWPWTFPVLGLPLIFMAAGMVVWILNYQCINLWRVASNTVSQLLPLTGIMLVAGILVQVMTLSGARGLIALSVVTLPLPLIFALLFLILPISEGAIQYAVAPLLGVPLILLFNMKGFNPIIALAGMSVMWPIGDMLPPTAIVGRAAVLVAGYSGPYYKGFVRRTLIPAVFILGLSTLFVVFSNNLKILSKG